MAVRELERVAERFKSRKAGDWFWREAIRRFNPFQALLLMWVKLNECLKQVLNTGPNASYFIPLTELPLFNCD